MNKNSETQVLLERYGRCDIPTREICESLFTQKYGLQETKSEFIYIVVFIKSPEFGDNKRYLDFIEIDFKESCLSEDNVV